MPLLPIDPAPDFRGRFPAGWLLDDFDFHVELGGLVLGAVDSHGVEVNVTQLDGWWGPVGSTGRSEQKSGADGAWLSPANATARYIRIGLHLIGLDWSHLTQTIAEVNAALPLRTRAPFSVTDSDGTRTAMVRQESTPEFDRRQGDATYLVDLVADDPNKYGLEEVTLSTGLPVTAGGLAVPFNLPVDIGATFVAGSFVAVNAGDGVTVPVLTIAGPCPAGAVITHQAGGVSSSLRYDDAIGAGHALVVDPSSGLGVLDGVAARTLTGTRFAYQPGENVVSFSASAYDADALLTSTHKNAWSS